MRILAISLLLIWVFIPVLLRAQGDEKTAASIQNPYALVAGGSKGIGYAISEALAKRGYNLILVARNTEALKIAKDKLQSFYQVKVEILSYDLSEVESAPAISSWCIENNIPLKMLFNVAGYGGSHDYLSSPIDSMRYMVNLNVESCMVLTEMLLPLLEKNAPAYVMNVSSMAGYAPIPGKNMYAATKSAVIFFSYALRFQLKEKNISVSCLTPGPVFTKPSIERDTREQLGWFGMQMAVPPSKVGEIAVRKTLRGKMTITPGFAASISARLIRLMPKRVIASLYYRIGKKETQQQAPIESVKK